MGKLPLCLILALFLVKANVASPSTESRFKHEAKVTSGETQESPLSWKGYITKYIKKIKSVVMERIENIKNWKNMEFKDEWTSLKEGLSSELDAVITDVQSKLNAKGTVYYYTPNRAHCSTYIYSN